MAETISGTVIQRSFVGRSVPNVINVATAPLGELGIYSTNLEDILSEILAVPRTTILFETEYAAMLRAYAGTRSEGDAGYVPGGLFARPHPLFEDFLSLIGRSTPFFPDLDMFKFVGGRLIEIGGIGGDKLQVAQSCLVSRLDSRSHEAEFSKEMLSYGIPLGQSPSTKEDSLLELLKTSRAFCVAPLAVGASPALSHLSQGNYVAALLTTGTASLMTLVLIGTVAVGSVMVQQAARRRVVSDEESKKDPPAAGAIRSARRGSSGHA